MKYIIYKTTNAINGKIYIGSHKLSKDDKYLGSGTILHKAIEKYGEENFFRVTLAEFDNQEDMFAMEAKLVNEEFVSRADTYNLKIGGHGGWDYANKRYKELLNDPVFYQKHLEKTKKATNGFKKKKETDPIFYANYIKGCKKGGLMSKGRVVSEETKNKLRKYRNSIKDKPYHSTETKEKISNSLTGKTHSDSTKEKISNAVSGKNNSQYGTIWITDGIENKKIKNVEQIPNGWNRGMTVKKERERST